MLPQFSIEGKFPRKSLSIWNYVIFFALMLQLYFFGWTHGKSQPYEYEEGMNRIITCYTCANISNNEDCNRYAIDRPCPAGKQFCMTLHVMEAMDEDRSILVNKRCASLDECLGGPTGCITAYEHTKCTSCCDYSYCNDYVPINETDAIFQRSTSSRSETSHKNLRISFRVLPLTFLSIIILVFNHSKHFFQ